MRRRAKWGASWDTALWRLESWAQSSRVTGLATIWQILQHAVIAEGEGTEEVREMVVGGKTGGSRQ